MSNNRNLGNIATAITNATSGQVLTSQGDGVATFVDAAGSGVTTYTGLSGTDGTPSGATYLLNVSSPSAGDLAYVTANTSLYQNNGNGWYKIATINTTPAISSVSETTSGSTTALSDNGTFALTAGSNTVVTITASDADEGTDLTYTHTVTSGTESNVATITQGSGASENVFTLAPAASVGGTITVRFDVTDNTNTAQFTNSFSLSFAVVGGVLFTTTGTHSWTVPSGVTSVSVVCIGGGGSGGGGGGIGGASGGGLGYKNNISVTPGSSITVVVGAGGSQFGDSGNDGGDSYFQSTSVCRGGGGNKKSEFSNSDVAGGTYTGDGGGNGGTAYMGANGTYTHGGAGAGGYSGTGGHSYGTDGTNNSAGGAGSGGGGGGGSSYPTTNAYPYYGGGTGVYGEGSNGAGGTVGLSHGGYGSGGYTTNVNSTGTSESYGGAAGTSGSSFRRAAGNGAVRVVWGSNITRAFPSTNVGYADSTDGETTV